MAALNEPSRFPLPGVVDIRTFREGITQEDCVYLYMLQDWKLVGEGAFSFVYYSRRYPGMVLKLFERDPGYLTYLKQIRRSQNPHFPRTSRVRKIRFRTYFGTLLRYAVLIERLKALRIHEQDHADRIGDFASGLSTATDLERYFKRYPKLPDAISLIQRLSDRIPAVIDIHDENILKRKSVPVITDPLV